MPGDRLERATPNRPFLLWAQNPDRGPVLRPGSRRERRAATTGHSPRTCSRKSSQTKDNIKGRIKENKGKVKEAVGRAVDSKTMERNGKVDQVKGKVQATYDDLKEAVAPKKK